MAGAYWGSSVDFSGDPIPRDFFAMIGQIACEIGMNLRTYYRMNVTDYKEKFGSVRVYCMFGWCNIFHSIIYPGYVFIQWRKWYNKWLYNIDSFISRSFIGTLINKIIIPIQVYGYKRTYRKAIEAHPFYKKYILTSADYPELLRDL